jgi:3'-phosphoadenosine 5'-phosphosulfate sulfotransferase (PAPS reductase)/FAD synthetase
MDKNNVISLSGGKDSTAMLIGMLERGERVHSVFFFDTGWEFPQMYEHLDKLEAYTGVKITRIHPERPFTYWMLERPVIARKGENKGKVHRVGNGWPSARRRWCTREKVRAIGVATKGIPNPVDCIGIAADEVHRTQKKRLLSRGDTVRYPLIEWGMDEAAALAYCQNHGFDWGGLYKHFRRVSCYCCPLQRIGDIRTLRRHFPELWQQMLEWDRAIDSNIGFYNYDTVHDLERRFTEEDRQFKLLGA